MLIGIGWSLWSKDIIILITSDSKAGPQAWVDAYHSEQTGPLVESLPVKSGALQGVIVVDNPLNHSFHALHIVYDGINGQLPNLDLFNTAVSVAGGQMGISVVLQRMWRHGDSYRERLQTMLRGMVNQGLGYSSGPHSSFIPYHVDAITLQAVGEGPQDEMAMGRVVEGVFRSLNNLLEHFHQSFFLYLLMQTDRFVSIGTYLPSAMLLAVNFTIMAIALWIRSGRKFGPKMASTEPPTKSQEGQEVEVIKDKGSVAVIPKTKLITVERHLFVPITLVVGFHFLGLAPLYMFNHLPNDVSSHLFPSATDLLTPSEEDVLPVVVNVYSFEFVVTYGPGAGAPRALAPHQSAPASSTMLFSCGTWNLSRNPRHPQFFAGPFYRPVVHSVVFHRSATLRRR